jgi:hypothetical protein
MSEEPAAPQPEQTAAERRRRSRAAAGPPRGGQDGSFDLPNLALLERLLNSGPTGVGFG